jgi:hypothetical protein
MRKLRRSIAKARMRQAGIGNLFRKSRSDGSSAFSRGWRSALGIPTGTIYKKKFASKSRRKGVRSRYA